MHRLRSTASLGLTLLLVALALLGCGKGDLALRLKQGDQFAYHVLAESTFDISNVKAPEGTPLPVENLQGTLTMEYDTRLNVDKLTTTVAEVTYDITDFKGEMNLGGEKQPFDSLPELKLTVTVNPTNLEVLDIKGLPELGSAGSALDQETFRELIKESFAQLPDSGRAKVGDTWTVDAAKSFAALTSGADQPAELKVTYTYEANENRDGRQLARIKVGGSGPLDVNMNQSGLDVAMKGDITMSGYQFIDLASGMPDSADITTTMKVTQSMSQSGAEPVMSMDMEMTMHVTMERK